MTTSKFPLLKLPLLPLEDIAKQMDFVSLLYFRFSMVSRKSKDILKLLKVPIDSIVISITEDAFSISIRQHDDDKSIIEISQSLFDARTLAFFGRWGSKTRTKIRLQSTSTLETLEKVVNHILSIAKVEKLSFSCDGIKEIRNLFIFRITKQFYKLTVQALYISSEDLTFLLDDIFVYRLNLNVDWSCLGFKYRKPIKHPIFTIRKCDWLDFETLTLAPDTISARYDNAKVNNSVLDRLIQDWKEGKNLKLKEVLFTYEDNGSYRWNYPNHPKRIAFANESVAPLNGNRIAVAVSREAKSYPSILYTTRLSVSYQIGRDQPGIAIVG